MGKKKIWIDEYWVHTDKRINSHQPEMIYVSLGVRMFNREWTIFCTSNICEVIFSKYQTIDDFSDFEVRFFDIAWNKYFGINMPRTDDFEYCGKLVRPTFDHYPEDLIKSLSNLKDEYSENVTKFMKNFEKFEIAVDDYFNAGKTLYKYSIEKDNFPDCEEISNMTMYFNTKEEALEFLDKLEKLLN